MNIELSQPARRPCEAMRASLAYEGIFLRENVVRPPLAATILYLGDAGGSTIPTSVEFEHEDHYARHTVDATVWSQGVKIGKSKIATEVHVFGTGTETSIAVVTMDDVSLCSGLEFGARETIFEKAIPPNKYHKEPVVDRNLEKYYVPVSGVIWVWVPE